MDLYRIERNNHYVVIHFEGSNWLSSKQVVLTKGLDNKDIDIKIARIIQNNILDKHSK